MQILDRLIGHAAQFFGLGGALAQHRHQRLGALQQLRKLRRPTGPAPLWATLSRLGHPTPHSLAAPGISRLDGGPTLPAALTRGEIVDNVAARRQECSRCAAGPWAQFGEDPVIYMVEMDFPHPGRLPEWHDWYLAHIRVLLTVPGFRASQRFEAVVGTHLHYLALHEVESAALFDSEAYRSRGGPASTGEWRQLQTNWHRNLLAGLDAAPDVPAAAYLLVLRDAPGIPDVPGGLAIRLLDVVGLDRTVKQCGLAVLNDPAPVLDLARRDWRVQ